MPLLGISAIGESPDDQIDWAARTCPLHLDPAYRADEAELLLRKNYFAVGSFEREHRAQALDQLGFASQLVFNTWSSGALVRAEQGDDVELAYEMAPTRTTGRWSTSARWIGGCSPSATCA